MPFITIDPSLAEAAPVLTIGAPLMNEGETLGSLRTELLAMLGNRTDASPTRLATWINKAYRDICSSLDLDELKSSYAITSVIDQPLYALPTVVGHLLGVAVADTDAYPIYGGRELTKTDIGGYRRLEVSSGDVTKYLRYGRTLVLWPNPSAAKTVVIDFVLRPKDLTDPSDSPILPVEWHEAILLLARVKAHSGLLEFQIAKDAMTDYNNFIATRVDRTAEERTSPDARVAVVRSRRGLLRNREERNPAI